VPNLVFEALLLPLAVVLPVLLYQTLRPSLRPGLRRALLEHLAVAAERSLPLGPAILALAREHEAGHPASGVRARPREAELLRGVAARAGEGGSLADGLAGAPDLIGPREVDLVRRAEGAGALPEVLAALRSGEDAARERRWRIIEIGAYPLVLALLVGLQLAFAGGAIYPKFDDIARSLDLPGGGPDYTLANAATGLYALVLAVGLPAGVLALGGGRARRTLERAAGALGRWLPGLGQACRDRGHAVRLVRAAAFLRAGATLPESLAGAAAGGGPEAADLRRASEVAGVGQPLERVLAAALGADAGRLLPRVLLEVEHSGSLPAGLEASAAATSARAASDLRSAARAAAPLPVILCAGAVAANAATVWTLIVEIESSILRGLS